MKLAIGENIKSYRKSLGLTQEQLAEAVGVTVGAVSKWESGLSNPDISIIVVLANFFEISVDVLLGYSWKTTNVVETKDTIRKLCYEKKYEEGKSFIHKALLRYPNCFDIVFESACLYHMAGTEKRDKEALNKALELYTHAIDLLSQNTQEDISEVSIQNRIGEVYICLEDTNRSLKHLKKYNYDGINNGKIGLLLAVQKHSDEALPYLTDSILGSVTELFRTVIGFSNYYSYVKKYKEALEIVDWMQQIIKGLMVEGKVSFLDKAEVILLTARVHVYALMDLREQAKETLKEAIMKARRFDATPSYDIKNVRYLAGKEQHVFDDFGCTAEEGILHSLNEEDNKDMLMQLWNEIKEEEHVDEG